MKRAGLTDVRNYRPVGVTLYRWRSNANWSVPYASYAVKASSVYARWASDAKTQDIDASRQSRPTRWATSGNRRAPPYSTPCTCCRRGKKLHLRSSEPTTKENMRAIRMAVFRVVESQHARTRRSARQSRGRRDFYRRPSGLENGNAVQIAQEFSWKCRGADFQVYNHRVQARAGKVSRLRLGHQEYKRTVTCSTR